MGKPLASSNNDNRNNVGAGGRSLPLLSLNHVSYVCKSVQKSAQFYEQVLGFVLVQRPSSFDFEGAWLFNHGIGIHLLEAENTAEMGKKGKIINPKDNHISFQCSDMDVIIGQLEEMGIEYVKAVVREGGIVVDQLFFHDPDGYMIEICNCHNLPLLPISSSSACPLNNNNNKNSSTIPKSMITSTTTTINNSSSTSSCSGEAADVSIMDNLAHVDIIDLSI